MLPVYHYESWSLYVLDIANRYLLVMDPTEASEPLEEMKAKHEAKAAKILAGLTRAVDECFIAWKFPKDGWTFDYNTGMHESFMRQHSEICIEHYIRELNGLVLNTKITQGNAPFPLIPCPVCGKRLVTNISKAGTRPGIRYYKCEFY
uniref:Uncharacterized protein n=1 Tax=Avena sativa TaxID=4498 RepID=A0ACD6A2F6_AVESA